MCPRRPRTLGMRYRRRPQRRACRRHPRRQPLPRRQPRLGPHPRRRDLHSRRLLHLRLHRRRRQLRLRRHRVPGRPSLVRPSRRRQDRPPRRVSRRVLPAFAPPHPGHRSHHSRRDRRRRAARLHLCPGVRPSLVRRLVPSPRRAQRPPFPRWPLLEESGLSPKHPDLRHRRLPRRHRSPPRRHPSRTPLRPRPTRRRTSHRPRVRRRPHRRVRPRSHRNQLHRRPHRQLPGRPRPHGRRSIRSWRTIRMQKPSGSPERWCRTSSCTFRRSARKVCATAR
jgi:hypothetical protein